MPAMSAPEPSPSRMNSKISCMCYLLASGALRGAAFPRRSSLVPRSSLLSPGRRRAPSARSSLSPPSSRLRALWLARGPRPLGRSGGWLEPAGRLDEHVLALVEEELGTVVADRGGRGDLAAGQ